MGILRTVDAFYRNWVRTMHDVQLLGGDVSESEQQGLRAPTVPADALLKGLPSPEGLPPRPPWFACNGHFAPTGKRDLHQPPSVELNCVVLIRGRLADRELHGRN